MEQCRFRVIREQQTKTAPNCHNGKMPTLMSTRSSWMGTDYNMCKICKVFNYLSVKYSSGLATFWATFIHFLNLFGCLLWILQLRATWLHLIFQCRWATSVVGMHGWPRVGSNCTNSTLMMDSSSISVMSKQTNQPTKSALLQAIRAALEILGWSLATNIWARKFARSQVILKHYPIVYGKRRPNTSLTWGSFFRI